MCPSLLSFFFSWKVAFDNLSFFAVSANIPSACEVLICLVDVLFVFLIDLLVIIWPFTSVCCALRLGFLRSLALSLEGHL